jgi:hypothetical protein
MKLHDLLTFHALGALLMGVGFGLAPAALLSLYGVTIGPGGIAIARLFGASHIGIGLLAWLARTAAASQAMRAIVIGYGTGTAVGFVVALLAQLSAVMNAFGWSAVGIYLLLALGYGYFLLVKPGAG